MASHSSSPSFSLSCMWSWGSTVNCLTRCALLENTTSSEHRLCGRWVHLEGRIRCLAIKTLSGREMRRGPCSSRASDRSRWSVGDSLIAPLCGVELLYMIIYATRKRASDQLDRHRPQIFTTTFAILRLGENPPSLSRTERSRGARERRAPY